MFTGISLQLRNKNKKKVNNKEERKKKHYFTTDFIQFIASRIEKPKRKEKCNKKFRN